MVSPTIFSRAFIGREVELRALNELRRAAFAGHGSLVLVAGDAGIGKTRLLREFSRSLTHGRALCVSTAAFPYAGQPYGPVLEALDDLLGRVPDALRNATELQTTLANVLPRLRRSIDSQATLRRADKHSLFQTIASAFNALADKRATVVLIEDLQWVDQGTCELLLYLTRSLQSTRLLFIVTYRSDELHRAHPLIPAVAKLSASPAVHRIALQPLSPDNTRALMRSALEGRENLPHQVEFDIERRSEGNPFFVEELLKSAIDRKLQRQGTEDLPLSIRGTVLERLNRFSPRDREILVQAAVIGRRFNADFVARTLALPPATLYPVLTQARDLQLIVEVKTAPNEYDFRHALIREAIYEELLLSQAQALHEKIAAALETLPESRSISDLAYHWWKAGDIQKSAHYNEQAGDLAAQLHANEDTVVYYDRALEALQRRLVDARDDGNRADGGSRQDVARLHRKIGNALFHLGRPDDALRTFEQALKIYRAAGNPQALWGTYQNVARSLYNAGRTKDAIAALREALAALSERCEDKKADAARALLASYLTDSGEHKEALSVLEAVRPDSMADDPELCFIVHHTKALANAIDGRIDEWRSETNEARQAAPGVLERGTLIGFFDETALTASCIGDGQLSEEFFERSITMAREKKVPAYVSFVAIDYAFEKYLRGRLAEARALLEEALSVPQDMPVVGIRLAIAGLAVGTACADEQLIGRSCDSDCTKEAFGTGKGDFFGPLAALYARRLVQQGNPGEAEVLLHRAAIELQMLYGTFPLIPIIGAYGSSDDINRVRPLIMSAVKTQSSAQQAACALFEAHVEKRFGDATVAVKKARHAATAFRVTGWPLYEAAALELAGDAESALEIYRRVGAIGEARRFELKPTETIGNGVAKRGALSKREREIAHLVAAGKGNRNIANELHISEKTVEHHITSVLEKSGFSSRTELAAYIASLDRDRKE